MSSERDERPRAVIYLRVYRKQNRARERRVLDKQRQRSLEILHANGFELEAIYEDTLKDRGTLFRPGLEELIQRIQEPPQVRYVIFLHGSDDPDDSQALWELFKEYCE